MQILLMDGVAGWLSAQPGERANFVSVLEVNYNLIGVTHLNLLDFDIFIANLDDIKQSADIPEGYKRIGTEIIERVSGGGCLICFQSEQRSTWLPVDFRPHAGKGKRVTVPAVKQPLADFFERHKDQISYKTQFEHNDAWFPTLLSMSGYPVAGYARYDGGSVFMMPVFTNPKMALRDFLDNVLPHLAPHLKTEAPVTMQEDTPEWVHEFHIGSLPQVITQLEATEKRIHDLRAKLNSLDAKRRELDEFRGLLWFEGKPLERIVEKALNLLGIDAHPRGQIDLVCTYPGGGEWYAEIEGTTGAIAVRKGRQLLHYIADAEDTMNVRGAVIGNPFRETHPANRPPAGSQVGLFSEPLQNMARKQGWKLVTTQEVFEWVNLHFAGKTKQAASRARLELGLD